MIKLTDIAKEILNEDRCKRIADRRYSKPSAYKSGAIVRCRKGNIWKGVKEEIAAEEAHEDKNAIQTVLDGKRELGLISLKGSTVSAEKFWEIVKNNNLNTLQVPSNPFEMYIYYVDGAESKAKELKDIAEKYDGFLSYKATEEDSRRIGQLLGYKKEDIDDYIIKNKKIRGLDEAKKETLRTWFKRKGAAGKTGGWVDCNTCRKDKKTGRKKCKPCGRQKGEKRAKYPSCRPTPSQCGDPGKGKSWGKTK